MSGNGMIIDVIKLKSEGRQCGEFSFAYKADDKILGIPAAYYDGEVEVTAEIELLNKDVLANVTLKYAVCGECSRCLEAARGCVEHSFFAKFSLNPNAEEGEYRYSSGKVDLTAAVNEELILSAPATIYCKPDCKGLCPVCGANRNLCDCGHCD